LRVGKYSHGTLLYNLVEDPGVQENLAADYPERVSAMRQRIDTFQQTIDEADIRLLRMSELALDKKKAITGCRFRWH
jgi:hypothetical protein